MTSQQNKNYTAIEVVKADMKNLSTKVDEGFEDIKEQIGSLRHDIKDTYVTKTEYNIIRMVVFGALGAIGLAFIGAVIKSVGL